MTENLLLQPAIKLAQMIRATEISSSELIDTVFAMIEKQNPQLNAVISERQAAAKKEATQLQDHGQPFLGVPLLLKGLGQAKAGLPSTNGNRLFGNTIAQSSSNFTKALEAAGFIIIGQTNYPEFGFKNVTDSKMYGNAHNPWNLDYYPGGSSGGAGAVVAAGMLPLAAASDGGGSIRIPASWTGTIGLKPTRGRIVTGPGDWRSWQGAAGNFAITRSVTDTAQLLDCLQALQPAAVFQVPLNEKGFVNQLATKPNLTVGYTTVSPVGTPVDQEAIEAVKEAVIFLESQGIKTEEITWPTDGKHLMDTYYLMNEGETAAMFDQIEAGLGRSITSDDMEPLTWALYQTGTHVTASQYSRALSTWDFAGEQMAKFHQKYDLLLTPSTAMTAPKIDEPLNTAAEIDTMLHITELSPKEQQQFIWDQWLAALTRSPFTQQANLTGEPAISLPTHVTKTGLPIGIQFVAGKGQESQLLQIAKLFEDHHQFKFLH
ncbi:amidase [Lactobacillus sp. 3B(2020)]|uniref:amidase n=1 Tax=Lactobacillus sp. 3B(2020) TaxID=2695882 RepID=UPI0015DE8709|nr:amidase [Lactobacillus sp. 3B(2020)]QLL69411.1 amidase [Lactobacillus sp. 3B(2020)]